MKPVHVRILGIALTLAGVGALVASLTAMTQRLQGREVPMIWFGDPAESLAFQFADQRGAVESLETIPATDSAPARTHLRLRWRDAEIPITLDAPEDDRFPGLLRYGDWMKILPMAELPAGTEGGRDELLARLQDKSITPSLVVLLRFRPEGFDPDSWGSVRRKDWNYRFIELRTAGLPTHVVHDRNYRELQDMAEVYFESLDFEEASALKGGPGALAQQVLDIGHQIGRRAGDEDLWLAAESLRDRENAGAPPAEIDDALRRTRGALRDRFWQYQAMLMVTPKLHQPRTKVVDYGISSMGWTWPVAGVAALGVTVGALLVASSFVKRD